MSNNLDDSQTKTRGTLLVVDGHSLAFRAFFALPVDNFSTQSGQATNAVWGFASMLSQVLDSEKPDRLAVAFDVKGGTFRNQMLPQYKGTREAAPEELLTQLPLIQRMLSALGVTYIEKPGFEGDDVIGTLATMGEHAGYATLVLSGDRDAFQLIDDTVTVLYPGHHFKDLKHMTPQAVEEKYHVTPAQYPDLAALRGETADNIPGVPGVGDGFAAKWINQYGGLDGIIEHADEIGGKKGEALRANLDQVQLNRKVNALRRDLDLGVAVDELTFGNVDADALDTLFAELEFGSRTKTRIVNSFVSGKPQQEQSDEAEEADSFRMPESVVITDAAQLCDWASKHMPPADRMAESVMGAVGQTTQSQTTCDDPVSQASRTLSAEQSDHTLADHALESQRKNSQCEQCAAHIAQAWTLHAEGSSKPGRTDLQTVIVLAGNEAAIIPAQSLCGVSYSENRTATANSESHDGEQHTNSSPADLCAALSALIHTHAGSMIVHGFKEQSHMFASLGLKLPEPFFDTKLAGYLVHPDFHAETIEEAAEHFLDVHLDADQKAQETQSQGQLDIDVDDVLDLADTDDTDDANHELEQQRLTRAALVAALALFLAPMIDERHQFSLLHTIELPVSDVLYGMESVGASIDMPRLVAMRDQFAADARQAQEIAWDAAGTRVNLQSPKQLQKVLFDDMGLKPTRKTKSGSYTTNAATLQNLYLKSVDNERANGFLGALLCHRETNKLKQIVQTLIDAVNPNDGRIHTTFEQTVAATGRLSSVDPNLQNIPNRNAQGREIRAAFVPGDGFESLLSSDYSQVELRIMADLSGDEALIEAFRSGADFHKYVASLVYGIPVEEISADQRSHVKAMSYGLAYGLSTYGLAQQLKISPSEAEGLKAQYFATFGKVHKYLESLVSSARERGYTETMFGRRRYFPALLSTNRNAREAAERAALNAPIQGSAADIMKIAMIRAAAALHDAGLQSRIILQIHDELVVEVAPGEQERVSELVKNSMEHAVQLAVPLDVSTGIGADWQLAAH